MTSDELAPIIGAMTERPWGVLSEPGKIDPRIHSKQSHAVAIVRHEADAAAMATLANHAELLVDLVSACEAVPELEWTPEAAEAQRCESSDYIDGWNDAIAEIKAALRAVHAVGKEPSDG